MIFLLADKSIKLYKNLKFNKYVNIRGEVLNQTSFAIITLVMAIVSSFIEIYVSTNFLIFFKNFL